VPVQRTLQNLSLSMGKPLPLLPAPPQPPSAHTDLILCLSVVHMFPTLIPPLSLPFVLPGYEQWMVPLVGLEPLVLVAW